MVQHHAGRDGEDHAARQLNFEAEVKTCGIIHKMNKLKLISALTIVIVGLIVILQNTQPVVTRLLFIKITMPNAVLPGIALLMGMAMGLFVAMVISGKRKRI